MQLIKLLFCLLKLAPAIFPEEAVPNACIGGFRGGQSEGIIRLFRCYLCEQMITRP
jgi:hypothetical protein